MWAWITEKDANGNRVNVLNGKEAELNKRVHLAWNSCFTEPAGTDPEDAVGVSGEVVYVGTVSGTTCSEGYEAAELKGKVILTDSSLRNGFTFAQKVGAVAVASKATACRWKTEASSLRLKHQQDMPPARRFPPPRARQRQASLSWNGSFPTTSTTL